MSIVPNGGYSSSCLLSAARQHLASRSQGDTFNVHCEFLARTKPGPAIITIEDVKIGKKISTLHITLWQGEGILDRAPWITPTTAKRCILAYAFQSNFDSVSGLTLGTGYEEIDSRTRPETPNFESLLDRKGDSTWVETPLPPGQADVILCGHNWRMYFPRSGPLSPGAMDMWMCTASGELVKQDLMPYIVDTFPPDVHMWVLDSATRAMLLDSATAKTRRENSAVDKELKKRDSDRGNVWIATAVLDLENKRPLPAEGIRWLNMRTTTTSIVNGVCDLQTVIRNKDGEILAVSHQVSLILTMDRNKGAAPKPSL